MSIGEIAFCIPMIMNLMVRIQNSKETSSYGCLSESIYKYWELIEMFKLFDMFSQANSTDYGLELKFSKYSWTEEKL